jgi:hypothetical protein
MELEANVLGVAGKLVVHLFRRKKLEKIFLFSQGAQTTKD